MSAPAISVRKSGGQVRNREDHTITGSINGEEGCERFALPPNKWVTVSENVYRELKHKFSVQEERLVPDHDANALNPHRRGEAMAMRSEDKPCYTLEFKD